MFYRMLKNALLRRKKRVLTIAFTVALGISLATAMLNVMMDIGDKVNQELKAYGANLMVVPRGASLLNELYDFDNKGGTSGDVIDVAPQKYVAEKELPQLKMIFWAYNITDFAPFLEMQAYLPDGKTFSLLGTWFHHKLPLPSGEAVVTGIKNLRSWWDITGSWATTASASHVPDLMLGETLAKKLGLKVGDTVSLRASATDNPQEFKITGIIHSGGDEDDKAYAPLSTVQEMTHRKGLVQYVEVSALTTPENELARRAAQDPDSLSMKERDTWYCTAYISSIAYQIEEAMTDVRAKPVLQVAESEGVILQKTQLLMMLLTILTMVCSALAISNLVTAGVMERSTEIGLLKAIGATDLDISLLILAEILLISFLGGVVGYFAGLFFAQIIGQTVFGSSIEPKAIVIPLVTLLAFLVAIVGSLPAVRMLLALHPTDVLHGK